MRLNMEEASVISITVIMRCNYVNLNVVSCKSFGEPSLGNAVEFPQVLFIKKTTAFDNKERSLRKIIGNPTQIFEPERQKAAAREPSSV